jgi:DNA-binding NarL/FixJ family response regulator
LQTARDRISILVVDDHPAVRYGLVELLDKEPDFEVVGAAASCKELCSKATDLQPDVVVMDLEMDDSSGAEAVARLRRQRHKGHIVVFSAHDQPELVLEVLELNVQGYIKKAASRRYLCEAIRAATHGGLYLDPCVAPKVLGQLAVSRKLRTADIELTKLELTVLEHIAAGMRNRDIGSALDISERAVKYHVTAILAKLGVKSRTQAVETAVRRKLISWS